MDNIQKVILNNITWILSIVVAVGVILTTIKFQKDAIAENACDIKANQTRLYSVEKTLVRLDAIEKDISEIKADCKEIKKILFRPIVDKNDSFNKISQR